MYEERTGQPLERGRVFMRVGELTVSRRDSGADTVVDVVTDRRIVMLGNALTATRDGNQLTMRLVVAPRTKKNHGRAFGIKQSEAYTRYRDWIVRAMESVKAQLALPLPARPYNIAVTYYVDRAGTNADKCGLDQGLYDALQNAGVVDDDYWFRTDDGTRIIADDPEPRIELTITPLPDPAEAP
jgi:Holliday junction resolvase RusA-like endonuclease